MFKWILTGFCIFSFFAPGFSQQKGLVLGRFISLPDPGGKIELSFSDSLTHDSLRKYAFVLVFSSAHSNLSDQNIDLLQEFVINGGGLYIGADNWPFLAESNQLTLAFFGKSCWGDQSPETALVNSGICSNQVFAPRKQIPSGKTTVSFPLDYRLKVEAWTGDEPLILSGKFGKGTIILDGGYSRFNTKLFPSQEAAQIFREVLLFLLKFPPERELQGK